MNPSVIAELERIAEEHGGILRPVDVVSVAEDPSSVLHPYYEWDDSKAGHLYRLEQARGMIQACVTIIAHPDIPEKAVSVRMYTSLTRMRTQPDGGYMKTAVVIADKELRKEALCEALTEFIRWKQKYAGLKELSSIFDSLSDLQRRLGFEE